MACLHSAVDTVFLFGRLARPFGGIVLVVPVKLGWGLRLFGAAKPTDFDDFSPYIGHCRAERLSEPIACHG